ncbi:MAG TPA: hypothetical protein VGX94_11735, partial [Terriglobia bacterium]|nr:hypothetical protein [Terriglobia bacterium]
QGNITYASSQDFINNALADYNFVGQLTLGGERRTVITSYAEDTWKARPTSRSISDCDGSTTPF